MVAETGRSTTERSLPARICRHVVVPGTRLGLSIPDAPLFSGTGFYIANRLRIRVGANHPAV